MTSPAIDPFGYWPAKRSSIAGLGGTEPADDQGYVFHSSYLPVAVGRTAVEIEFEELDAKSGLFSLRVFELRNGGITEAAQTTVLLPPLSLTPRPVRLPFQSREGAQYAFVGYVIGDCEASASAVRLTVAPSGGDEADPEQGRSQFGRKQARRATRISTDGAPTLAYPVSQGFTERQLEEPDFAYWGSKLDAGQTPEQRWEAAYILRVLDVYGRLLPGAKGGAIATADDRVAPLVEQAGCAVTTAIVTDGQMLSSHLITMTTDWSNAAFDFIWAHSAALDGGGPDKLMELVDQILHWLKPGGLGIILRRWERSGEDGGLDTNAIQKLALALVAAGHIVGQLRFAAESEAHADAPFGLIVRAATASADR